MANKNVYDHSAVEKKWTEKWKETGIYKTPDSQDRSKKKFVLDMFPYPSGATMHVGHLEGYIGTDILSRYLRMNSFSVLHPMGWDAFGLPAENYAIKTGIPPEESTHKNIETFKRQLNISGLSYDWSREIDTSSPEFYKWTQWLFLLMYKRGLAYKKKAAVNWCPKDETVLANEQVIDGKCERCDTEVIQKELDQWFFKITDYADRLISGLDSIDWLPEVKVQQKNWIGKSEGMRIKFGDIEVFTTRPDTLEGATFIAVSQNHPLLDKKYDFKTDTKEKEGKFTGKYATNPLTGKEIPVWAVNYVDLNYGTGAIMGVPAHDERDREFATKYQIDIVDMKPDSTLWKRIEKEGWGKKEINYHLRDWLISRQRYWGAPIPMIYCEKCKWQPVPEEDLPIKLPTDVDFLPHGESPIARSKSFQEGVTCPNCGSAARREVDTMDTFVDSSWYFIRFVDPNNEEVFADAKKMEEWLPVDIYVGGGHVVQHLLFARFFWKVIFDAGLIDKSLGEEPFLVLRAPGWILGPDSRKMSKRWGNVITPDDIIPKFGADVLRLYEMFMGPFDMVKPWSISGVDGMHRFVNRIWGIFEQYRDHAKSDEKVDIKMQQTIKKVTNDIENLRYNTAISSLMEYTNVIKAKGTSRDNLRVLILLLAPFAPFLAEELWERLGEKYSVHSSEWPKYDENKLVQDSITIVVMVDGKPRDQFSISNLPAQPAGGPDCAGRQFSNKEEIIAEAKKREKVKKWIEGKEIRDTIFVPGRLLNFVTK